MTHPSYDSPSVWRTHRMTHPACGAPIVWLTHTPSPRTPSLTLNGPAFPHAQERGIKLFLHGVITPTFGDRLPRAVWKMYLFHHFGTFFIILGPFLAHFVAPYVGLKCSAWCPFGSAADWRACNSMVCLDSRHSSTPPTCLFVLSPGTDSSGSQRACHRR